LHFGEQLEPRQLPKFPRVSRECAWEIGLRRVKRSVHSLDQFFTPPTRKIFRKPSIALKLGNIGGLAFGDFKQDWIRQQRFGWLIQLHGDGFSPFKYLFEDGGLPGSKSNRTREITPMTRRGQST